MSGRRGDAMPMKFRCTSCTARLHVPRRWAGTTIECPKCTTRVVVPVEPDRSETVRFEDRSIEKRIEAFEAATLAAVTAAASAVPSSPGDGPPTSTSVAGRERFGRAMVAVPSGWIPLFTAAVLLAIAAAGAAGFWAGWLASQAAEK